MVEFFSICGFPQVQPIDWPVRQCSDRPELVSFQRYWRNLQSPCESSTSEWMDDVILIFSSTEENENQNYIGLTWRIEDILLFSVTSPLFKRSSVAVNSWIWSNVSSFILSYSSSVRSFLRKKEMSTILYTLRNASTEESLSYLHSSKSIDCWINRSNWFSKFLIIASFAMLGATICLKMHSYKFFGGSGVGTASSICCCFFWFLLSIVMLENKSIRAAIWMSY